MCANNINERWEGIPQSKKKKKKSLAKTHPTLDFQSNHWSFLSMDEHLPSLLQVLILSPYETGTRPKGTMSNTTRSVNWTAGATTSPHGPSSTHYKSSSNTTQVRSCAALAVLLFFFTYSLFIASEKLLSVTPAAAYHHAGSCAKRPLSVTEGDEQPAILITMMILSIPSCLHPEGGWG